MIDPIDYLTPAEIYELAEAALGRPPDVRDRHLLRAAAARPMLAAFGEQAYPGVLDKAAALLHALAAHHLFFDGNKRTATLAVVAFLRRNGFEPAWSDGEIYAFVLEIAQSRHEVADVAAWLAVHTNEHMTPPRITPRYVTADELIYINEMLPGNDPIHRILKGRQKVRDLGLLDAAVGRPQQTVFGEDAYPTLVEKAAVLLHAVARNHPFADGNKRTGTLGALFMLHVNGQRVIWDEAAALLRIVRMAEGQLDAASFAAWLTTEPVPPQAEPEVEADMRLIADLIAAHRWLLDELNRQ